MTEVARGRFRIKGDVLEIGPFTKTGLSGSSCLVMKLKLFAMYPTTGEILQSVDAEYLPG